MIGLILAACLAGHARAQLTSDAAWARFRAARPPETSAGLIADFNRLVFREYRNLALFAGDAGSDRSAFLEDFLLYFPRSVVVSGHAALSGELRPRLRPDELNLIVLDLRLLPARAALVPLLERVDAWNREGFLVKVVVR